MPDLHALLMQNIGTVLTGLASLAAVLALVWLKKHFVTWKAYDARQEKIDKRFADHDARLSRQSDRVAAIEGGMSRMTEALGKLATREDMLNLELSISEMRGGLREVNATVQGVREAQDRQEEQINMLTERLMMRQ